MSFLAARHIDATIVIAIRSDAQADLIHVAGAHASRAQKGKQRVAKAVI